MFSFFRISGSEVIGSRLCSVGLAPYARLSERTSRRSVFVTAFIFSSLQSLSPFFCAVNRKKHFLNKKTAQYLFPFRGQMLHSVLTVSCSATRRKNTVFLFMRLGRAAGLCYSSVLRHIPGNSSFAQSRMLSPAPSLRSINFSPSFITLFHNSVMILSPGSFPVRTVPAKPVHFFDRRPRRSFQLSPQGVFPVPEMAEASAPSQASRVCCF